jgi:hypothetical protein
MIAVAALSSIRSSQALPIELVHSMFWFKGVIRRAAL